MSGVYRNSSVLLMSVIMPMFTIFILTCLMCFCLPFCPFYRWRAARRESLSNCQAAYDTQRGTYLLTTHVHTTTDSYPPQQIVNSQAIPSPQSCNNSSAPPSYYEAVRYS